MYHLALASLDEEGSLDGINVNVKNSTIHSYDSLFGNYYYYDSHVTFDENSKLLIENVPDFPYSNVNNIYGNEIQQPFETGKELSKPFETRSKKFFIRLLSKEFVEQYESYDQYLNSLEDPILKTSANITGVRGSIYKEAQFTAKCSGSNVTNVEFNNIVRIYSKASNIKFVNCTFNNVVFMPEDHNITFDNCVLLQDIQYIDESDDPIQPAAKTIILTAENYNEYVTDKELNDNVNDGDTIDMQGLFDSSLKGLIINKEVNIISSTNDANISLDSGLDTRRTGNKFTITPSGSGTNITGISFYNTRVTIDGANDVSINNITCTDYMEQIGQGVGAFSIRNSANNISVTNSNFYTHGNYGHSTLVIAGAHDVLIENNTIIGETDEGTLGKIGNLFYITTYDAEGDNYNITVRGNTIDASNVLHDNEICNPVRIQGAKITIEDNVIISNDDAILEQWVEGSEVLVDQLIVRNNNVTGRVGLFSTNVLVTDNNLDTLVVSNSTVTNNNIKNLNIGDDSIVKNNNITESISIGGNTLIDENNIYASIDINNSNVNITNNNITSGEEYAIVLNGQISDISILNNNISSLNGNGKKAVNDNSIEYINDFKDYNVKVDTTEFTVGESATISASICYGDDVVSTLNKGKVTFKINGKTLKDAEGKVIYAKVVNGTATVDNYLVPESWNKDGTNIQAVYSGSVDVEKMSSDKVDITVTAPKATITTENVTAQAGTTVTLKATINCNATVNTGKVVFKINGKTVKDADGKVIYAKVVDNQVSVDYEIPSDMKVKDYTLTAVFVAPGYDKLEDTKTLTVTAA